VLAELKLIASVGSPLAAAAARRVIRRLQGGDLDRLAVELDKRFGSTTGLSVTALMPIFEDVDLIDALDSYIETGQYPRKRVEAILTRYVAPLHPGQTEDGAAEEVASAIEAAMFAALVDDREALGFGLQRLRADAFAAPSSLREEDVTAGDRASIWQQRFAVLHYLNVSRLALDPAIDIEAGLVEGITNLTSFRTADPGQMIGALVLFNQVLESWEQTAIDAGRFAELNTVPVGARLSFNSSFYTKNLAGKNPATIEGLTGSLVNDPHIWARAGNARVYLPIDARWITSASATYEFSSGQVSLAGLGILRAADTERLIISPLALGMPLTEQNAWFYDPERFN
jgi:hypothetical protein